MGGEAVLFNPATNETYLLNQITAAESMTPAAARTALEAVQERKIDAERL